MEQESDAKSPLVLQILFLSKAATACPHRHGCSSVRSFKDWYRLLGIEENSDIADIRKRYHELALQLHPDKNKHPMADIAFKLILEAYSCLSNSEKRKEFDVLRRKSACVKCRKYSRAYMKNWSKNLQRMKEMQRRLREETEVMELCLRVNAALKKELPTLKEDDFQSKNGSRSQQESPVFDPSNYLFRGYPHIRNNNHGKIHDLWQKQQPSNISRKHETPLFQNRSTLQGMPKNRFTFVHC